MSSYELETQKLTLTSNCWIEYYVKEWGRSLSLEYIEESPDPWYRNTQTSIEIDKKMAMEIVILLTKHFEL